jgi:hypothetical protein
MVLVTQKKNSILTCALLLSASFACNKKEFNSHLRPPPLRLFCLHSFGDCWGLFPVREQLLLGIQTDPLGVDVSHGLRGSAGSATLLLMMLNVLMTL